MISNQYALGSLIFIFGACVGSFLNVCIYRLPLNKSIVTPGSSCPYCKRNIPFYYNIPIVSYFVLSGKCRFCNSPISFRYPLVEMITALFSLLLFIKFSLSPTLVFWFSFVSVLLTISLIDLDHQIIPDRISIPGILIFGMSSFIIPEMTLKNTIWGILIGGGSLYAVAASYYLFKKEVGMGGGDIKLLAMIGGAIGVKGAIFTIFAGSLLGTISEIIIMISTRITGTKLKIPFGPYLSAGAILYIFWRNQIIYWYMNSVLL
jgi:leader peptidase (prepilin peptidase) / N-methyltransferase